MRVVAARLPVEIPAIAAAAVLRPEALVRGPGFQQRAVHREVFVADQILHARHQHGVLKELPYDRRVEQAIPVEREGGVIPHGIVDVQAHEPAEQQVVVHLLHQPALAVDHLQQRSTKQALGRNRWPAAIGIALGGQAIQLAKYRIYQHAQLADRVVDRNTLFHRNVREHAKLLDVGTAHRGVALLLIASMTAGSADGFSTAC